MPELLVAWVAFPAIQILIWLGCGSLAARVVPGEIPRALLAPLGFCVVVVAGGFTTAVPALAALTTPVVVGLALAGFVLAPPWRGGLALALARRRGSPPSSRSTRRPSSSRAAPPSRATSASTTPPRGSR